MDDHDGPRARRDGPAQRLEFNLPAVVVNQLVGHQLYVLNVSEKRKERIAGLRHQHLVSGIAQQTEAVGVGLAGADGKNDPLRRKRDAPPGVIGGHGLARRKNSLGGGLVFQCPRMLQRAQNALTLKVQPHGGGIGCRQVQQPAPAVYFHAPRMLHGKRVAVGGEVPLGSAGKHALSRYRANNDRANQ